ncbi:hypothetical protein CEXT_370831 [Caerostris extrusa]|uniref:Uncharacterized protein n=1 Tax=Caerostris extrusa TaxID=172846 RepID=A0AAV4XF69_CAEEX|nr:hypothetical protein CEXT_370831 [Caerostris extrusa]
MSYIRAEDEPTTILLRNVPRETDYSSDVVLGTHGSLIKQPKCNSKQAHRLVFDRESNLSNIHANKGALSANSLLTDHDVFLSYKLSGKNLRKAKRMQMSSSSPTLHRVFAEGVPKR